jgi:hypothetical protein
LDADGLLDEHERREQNQETIKMRFLADEGRLEFGNGE